MDLERDLFRVDLAGDGPGEAELIAAVQGAGFAARVTPSPPSPAAGGTVEPRMGPFAQAKGSAMPALIQEALDQAARERKLVLVDFYANWCLPCQRMLAETYRDPAVLAELERFVFLKVDTDAQPQIAKHFGVTGIPDARILRSDGQDLARAVGFKSADELLAILRAAAR